MGEEGHVADWIGLVGWMGPYFFERVHTRQVSLLSERKGDKNCHQQSSNATPIGRF